MNCKIEKRDGMYVVMVEKVLSIEKPFWKFWAKASKTIWVPAYRKDGKMYSYKNHHQAVSVIRLIGGTLV
jgi:hypothetical protein